MSRNTDGYVDVVDYGLTHPSSNVGGNQSIGQFPQLTEAGGRHVTAGRIALDWQPTDRLNIYVTADYTNQDGDPGAEVLIAAGAPGIPFDPTSQNPATSVWGFGAPTNVVPWLVGTDGMPVTVGCQFVPAGPYSCDTPPAGYDPRYLNYANYLDATAPTPQAPYKPYYAVPKNTFEGWGVHGTVTFDASDNLQIVWISSYRKYESTWAFDQDLTPVPIAQLNNINQHWAWSQELRLNFELADGLIEGTVGGFYFDQYGDYEARVDLNYVNPTIDFIHGPDETPSESKALFANITLHPTDALSLTGGVRYSDESKDYVYYRRNPDYTAPDAVPCFVDPTVGLFGSPNCLLVGFLATEGNFAGDRFDWRAVADYRFSDSFLAYASFSTGFKGGGVNPRPFVPDQALPFNPETLTTYEVGFKADVLDRRIRLNGAAFFNKYKDIQGTKLVCPESSLPFPCLRPDNVGAADVKGFELETQIYPVDGLTLDGSIAYLDFKYTSACIGGTLEGTSIPCDGITPYTPELTYAFGIQYDYEMDSGSMISARFDGAFQDDIFTTSENTPWSVAEGYFIANGRLTYTSSDDDWKVWVEVQNIFDKYYFLTVSDASNSLGIVSGAPGLPRTWSVGVRRKF